MTAVRTVLGPIQSDKLGFTAVHEHIQWGMSGWQLDQQWWRTREEAKALATEKLLAYKAYGGSAIVDVTGIGFGRDVPLFQELSRETGVHIIASTGFWAGFGVEPYFRSKDVGYLADLFTRELTDGILGTRVLAGMIKIGNDHKAGVYQGHGQSDLTPFEKTMFAAAARVSRQTGAPITTHGISLGWEQARTLKDAGADPSRVIIGHSDAKYSLDFTRDTTLARDGFMIAYDHVGMEPWSTRPYALLDEERADMCVRFLDAGFEDNLVISCDATCWAIGRPTPLNHVAQIPRSFAPLLRERGVDEATMRKIFVDNPARVLSMPDAATATSSALAEMRA